MKLRIPIFIILIVGMLGASFTSGENKPVPTTISEVSSSSSLSQRTLASSKQNHHAKNDEKEESYEQKLAALHEAILEIQIQADKDHGVFVNRQVTENAFYETKSEVEFSLSDEGTGFIYEILNDFDHWGDALELSRELAKHRLSQDENEKFEILKGVFDLAAVSFGYSKTDEFIDCETGKIIYDRFDDDYLKIDFLTTVPDVTSSYQLGGDKSDNWSQLQLFSELDELSQSHKKNLRGVLYVSSPVYDKLQYCEFKYPNAGYKATLAELKKNEKEQEMTK
ncbi:MAG: hypothetical protein H0V66_01125 [Bdellovibrionales bacterium]|nr:hypothetical protein [Bdellovibrionales bacterium]